MARNEHENEPRERKRKFRFVLYIFLVLALLTSAFAIYEIFLLSSIENVLRYIVIGILIFIDLILFIKVRFASKKRKKKHSKHIGLISFMVIYSIICLLMFMDS